MATNTRQQLARKSYSHRFVIMTALYITSLITSNIIAVKLISVPIPFAGRGLALPAAIIIFPLSYIFGDILTEVYGYKVARRVIWLGFFCNLVAVVAIWLGQRLPAPSFWDGQAAYERILGYTPRLLVASFVAYLIGEFANAIVLAKMKIVTRGRWLWTRTIGSTVVGQGLDSLVFMTVAFLGTMPLIALLTGIVGQWIAKSAYEAAVTPLTYRIVGSLKRNEAVDVYDYGTKFNPFVIGG